MHLRMIRIGLLAGFAFLVAVAFLEALAVRRTAAGAAGTGIEGDISDQVWQVLAEARKITEESV